MNLIRNKKAFTLMELMVGLALTMLIIFVAHEFTTGTRRQYMSGTVNLQNLQDARLAINYLRRDFSCACPQIKYPLEDNEITISNKDDVEKEAYKNLLELRAQIFASSSFKESKRGKLIELSSNEVGGNSSHIAFYKYVFGSKNTKPKVAFVYYYFDKASRTLTRESTEGGRQTFSGFVDVAFNLYVHKLDENVPILWVSFKIHEGAQTFGSDDVGAPLELVTSITSPYLTSLMRNKNWRNDVGNSM